MLNQWSKGILEAWVWVYAGLLPILIKKDSSKEQKLINSGVQLARKMSQFSEPIQVRASSAALIGALATENSFLSASVFEKNFLSTIKSICQDYNWEVRKEISDQILCISKYIGAAISFENLFPEVIELIDDEEREVSSSSINAFANLIIEVYSKDEKVVTNDKIMIAVKKLLQNAHVLNKEDLNRILLEKIP